MTGTVNIAQEPGEATTQETQSLLQSPPNPIPLLRYFRCLAYLPPLIAGLNHGMLYTALLIRLSSDPFLYIADKSRKNWTIPLMSALLSINNLILEFHEMQDGLKKIEKKAGKVASKKGIFLEDYQKYTHFQRFQFWGIYFLIALKPNPSEITTTLNVLAGMTADGVLYAVATKILLDQLGLSASVSWSGFVLAGLANFIQFNVVEGKEYREQAKRNFFARDGKFLAEIASPRWRYSAGLLTVIAVNIFNFFCASVVDSSLIFTEIYHFTREDVLDYTSVRESHAIPIAFTASSFLSLIYVFTSLCLYGDRIKQLVYGLSLENIRLAWQHIYDYDRSQCCAALSPILFVVALLSIGSVAVLNAIGLSVSLYGVLHIFATNQVERANLVPLIPTLLIGGSIRIAQSFFVYATAAWDVWFLSTETEEERKTRRKEEKKESKILSKYGIRYTFSQVSLATYATFLVAFPKMFIEMTFNPDEKPKEPWWSYLFNVIPALFFGVVYARWVIELSSRIKGVALIGVSATLTYLGGIGSQYLSQYLAVQIFDTLDWKHEAEQTGDEFIGAIGSGFLFAFFLQVIVIINAWRNKTDTNTNVSNQQSQSSTVTTPLNAGENTNYQAISNNSKSKGNPHRTFKFSASDSSSDKKGKAPISPDFTVTNQI